MPDLDMAAVSAGVLALLATALGGVTLARHARGDRRYRPGRPFTFDPVWITTREDTVRGEPTDHGTDADSRIPAPGGASGRW